uniref:Uncharacterized protein n=1 Tax=viral metagenome TaxID=1070528 RepID=A0A6C0IC98_9ZZZZ
MIFFEKYYRGLEKRTNNLRHLLSQDSNWVSYRNASNHTLLHIAAIDGNVESARLLLAHGADMTETFILDWKKTTAMDICRKKYVAKSEEMKAILEGRHQIAKMMEEEERAYLVFKGFAIVANEHELCKKRELCKKHLSTMEWEMEHPTLIQQVLDQMWSKSNYDVFREWMEYLV